MNYIELYGENNQENLLPSMIKRKFKTDAPCEEVAALMEMTDVQLANYEEAHKEEWRSYLEAYVPPEPGLWGQLVNWWNS